MLVGQGGTTLHSYMARQIAVKNKDDHIDPRERILRHAKVNIYILVVWWSGGLGSRGLLVSFVQRIPETRQLFFGGLFIGFSFRVEMIPQKNTKFHADDIYR